MSGWWLDLFTRGTPDAHHIALRAVFCRVLGLALLVSPGFALSCRVLVCLVLSCLVLSCLVLCCLVLSCLVFRMVCFVLLCYMGYYVGSVTIYFLILSFSVPSSIVCPTLSRLVWWWLVLTGEHPPNQDHDADVKADWDKLSQDEKVGC